MGDKFEKSLTKELFVVLTRDQSAKLSKKHILQCSAQVTKTSAKRLPHLGRPLQECMVILERLPPRSPKQEKSRNNQHIKRVGFDDTILKTKSANVEPLLGVVKPGEVEIEEKMQLFSERLPVYKQTVVDNFKSDCDLYEFDEPDCDKCKDVGTTRRKPTKKRKNHKPKNVLQSIAKKHRVTKLKTGNSYDVIVQEIVQNVLKRVNKDRFENKDHNVVKKQLHDKLDTNILNKNEKACILPYASIEAENLNNINMDRSLERKDNENHVCENDNEANNSKELYFCTSLNPMKKINVISDVILNNSASSFLFEDLEPNANSTIICAEKCDPWRFNDNLKRNPHYLCIKKTALPCLQQDMVLDYNLVKSIDKLFGRTSKDPEKKENTKNTKKATPDIGYLSDSINKENIPQLSLFDDENVIVPREKSVQEYLTLKRPKRKVLGPILQNSVAITKTINFSEDDVPQNVVLARRDQVFEKPSTEKLNTNLVTSDNNESDVPNLFEDEKSSFNFDENSKIYIPKVRKKKKLFLDNFVSNQGKPKNDVRSKNEMTKTEKAELEQWAAKFNSMCEEIENHDLEIE